jgi:hypothetical protein
LLSTAGVADSAAAAVGLLLLLLLLLLYLQQVLSMRVCQLFAAPQVLATPKLQMPQAATST